MLIHRKCAIAGKSLHTYLDFCASLVVVELQLCLLLQISFICFEKYVAISSVGNLNFESFKLNPDAVDFFPASGHSRGKREVWRLTSVRKQQIRYAGGDERCGRCRVGLLNPLGGKPHKQGMYFDRWTKQKIGNEKKRLARKGRRRARPERRRKVKIGQNVAGARSRTGELNVATWSVRSLSLTGRRGADHAEVL